MYLTPAQIKGRIKNVAKQNGSDPITLLRIYMMERFLERITYSKYKDDFIVKGGILVTSMIGISMRSTMDIDTTIRNFDLTKEETTRIVNEIKDISLDDHIEFILNDVSDIKYGVSRNKNSYGCKIRKFNSANQNRYINR